MSEAVKEGPSNRALKQLTNRNNLADLKLRKALEQFDRERSFNMAHLDRDKLDTRDFLKHVRYCDSDYLPQSRTFLGSPSQRRRRSHTARTAPGRITREVNDTDTSDDSDNERDIVDRDAISVPTMKGARLLASRKTTRPRKLDDFQRTESFLRRLREQVAIEELHSHYTDANYQDFITAAVSKIQRNVTPTIGSPSISIPNGPTTGRPANDKHRPLSGSQHNGNDQARFDLVYPIKLLGNFEIKHESRPPTPSPSLGSGSPAIRATPIGLPEGGALGVGARLVMTAPQPLKPWTVKSLNGLPTIPRPGTDLETMRAMLRSRFKNKPLEDRVRDFCQELDEIRIRRGQMLPQSVNGT